jgi:hypothetical protein
LDKKEEPSTQQENWYFSSYVHLICPPPNQSVKYKLTSFPYGCYDGDAQE